ncbi:MAG: acyltransferase [Phreatobacter sp.]|uniref:acyltransferase family protein n=1 Tax=Phreatobacter sp. TaxID=1966341 RepID=UPI0027338E83|nr:acyltransferase [Phreatobacter sp.]MDP2802327.1 acyltransferase [Phreatobacter sp.]
MTFGKRICGTTADRRDRMTPNDRLASIQYLRALAALMVVAYHVLGDVAVIGAAGVDVFFVISGLVIAMVTASKPVRPMVFAYDRVARILPLYWLFTALLVATKLLAPDLLPRLPLDTGWIVSSFLLIPTVVPGTADRFPFLYQGWTLWFEALFYLLVLAAMLVSRRRKAVILSLVLLALVATGAMLDPQGPVGISFTSPLLLEFLAGYLFGTWRQAGGRLPAASGLLLVGIGLLGFIAAAGFAGAPEGWPRILWWGLPALALVTGAVILDDSRRIGAHAFPLLLGDASYAVYLSHGIAISVLSLASRRAGWATGTALDQPFLALATGMAAVAVGVGVHLIFEKPLMRFLRGVRPRLLPPVAAGIGGIPVPSGER